MEEIKRKIAVWMDSESLFFDKKWWVTLKDCACRPWTPELGGKDLSEVLAKLDDGEKEEFYVKLPSNIILSDDMVALMDNCFWFQNPDNAKTILKAVAAVIE